MNPQKAATAVVAIVLVALGAIVTQATDLGLNKSMLAWIGVAIAVGGAIQTQLPQLFGSGDTPAARRH